MIQAKFEKTFEGWRNEARRLANAQVYPQDIQWDEDIPNLFLESTLGRRPLPKKNLSVPKEFIDLAQTVAYARDNDRWDLLYRILFRLQYENSDLLKISVDPDIHRAFLLRKSVSRDIHKMHAFVRFKKTLIDNEEVYVAWHKPEHLVVKPGTPFFARRFGDKKWSIFTPDESAHWNLKTLTFGKGMPQNEFDTKDDWDEVWKTYYKSIFNPARIKIKMMKAEMSPKYWSSMPETALIQDMIRNAPKNLQAMAQNQNRAAKVDRNLSLKHIKETAKVCQACPIYSKATQTVFGIGPENAQIMIVGEQPGDMEDLLGLPFQGPAGEVLNQCLKMAELKREDLYLTNTVKHFKWAPRGKDRLHQKANGSEVHACKPWLDAEIYKVKPKVILALGLTAATALLGKKPQISTDRGQIIESLPYKTKIIISWHPSAILRANSPEDATERTKQLIQDLNFAKTLLASKR